MGWGPSQHPTLHRLSGPIPGKPLPPQLPSVEPRRTVCGGPNVLSLPVPGFSPLRTCFSSAWRAHSFLARPAGTPQCFRASSSLIRPRPLPTSTTRLVACACPPRFLWGLKALPDPGPLSPPLLDCRHPQGRATTRWSASPA